MTPQWTFLSLTKNASVIVYLLTFCQAFGNAYYRLCKGFEIFLPPLSLRQLEFKALCFLQRPRMSTDFLPTLATSRNRFHPQKKNHPFIFPSIYIYIYLDKKAEIKVYLSRYLRLGALHPRRRHVCPPSNR